jgi:hypothetical protein
LRASSWIVDVGDAEGDGGEAEETSEEGLAARDGAAGGRERCEEYGSRDDERELFKDVAAAGVEVVQAVDKSFGRPHKREHRVDDRECQGAGASRLAPQEDEPGGEFDGRGEIGNRHAEGCVQVDVPPWSGEIARS